MSGTKTTFQLDKDNLKELRRRKIKYEFENNKEVSIEGFIMETTPH